MDFIQFITLQAKLKAATGHLRTATNYRAAARSFYSFLHAKGHQTVDISTITPQLMSEFEHYLLHVRGICRNTSSFYMRQLRAAYNRAAGEGYCKDCQPFRDVYKGIGVTRKRAISTDVLHRLFNLNLSQRPRLAFARDLFCFSFLARGIAFVDLAHLRKNNLEGSHLIYTRAKTGQQITVEVVPAMRQIIQRWEQRSNPHLFPILPQSSDQIAYETALRKYNRRLNTISQRYQLSVNLTSYIARHSWASEAYRLGVPIQTISTCMGHTTELTTRIYLQTLSTAQVDLSARMVVDAYTYI